ncbi:metallophosphoesterase [Sphingobacterium hotanense]|nr:metallophosphoesterase [Sphingobacterium hotanense]MCT1523659.1 metallophosphoesterase [Sphingobacterium hotanense]
MDTKTGNKSLRTGRTLVMGDIHGTYQALKQCLERSGFDYGYDTLIQLGDVADGHDGVYDCVEELLKIKNLVAISGNHDVWFREFIATDFHPYYWNHGGKDTVMSYLKHARGKGLCFPSGSGYKTSLNSSDIPATHRQFFSSQRLYYIDKENRCFVHGGFDRYVPFSDQSESTYYWDRMLWSEALSQQENGSKKEEYCMETPFREVYLGHTPTTNWGVDHPMRAFNIINMDTGAGSTGRLSIMDIDTGEYWQSDPIPDLYPPDKLTK